MSTAVGENIARGQAIYMQGLEAVICLSRTQRRGGMKSSFLQKSTQKLGCYSKDAKSFHRRSCSSGRRGSDRVVVSVINYWHASMKTSIALTTDVSNTDLYAPECAEVSMTGNDIECAECMAFMRHEMTEAADTPRYATQWQVHVACGY